MCHNMYNANGIGKRCLCSFTCGINFYNALWFLIHTLQNLCMFFSLRECETYRTNNNYMHRQISSASCQVINFNGVPHMWSEEPNYFEQWPRLERQHDICENLGRVRVENKKKIGNQEWRCRGRNMNRAGICGNMSE